MTEYVVPIEALGLLSSPPPSSLANAEHVFSSRYGFKVFRIDAISPSTKMVQLEVANRADLNLVNVTVRFGPAMSGVNTVAVRVVSSDPSPTFVDRINLVERSKCAPIPFRGGWHRPHIVSKRRAFRQASVASFSAGAYCGSVSKTKKKTKPTDAAKALEHGLLSLTKQLEVVDTMCELLKNAMEAGAPTNGETYGFHEPKLVASLTQNARTAVSITAEIRKLEAHHKRRVEELDPKERDDLVRSYLMELPLKRRKELIDGVMNSVSGVLGGAAQ